MIKSLTATGSLTAVAAVALALAAFSAGAQERRGPPAGMGPGMMGQGAAPAPGAAARGAEMRPGDGPRRAWRDMRRERRMARRIELLDTNKDGKITIEEIHAEQKRLLGAADVNGDGKLSVEEFRRRGRWFTSLRTISFFDMLDTDGDGQISEKELTDPSARWFSRYDLNKDKALDIDEFSKSGRRGDRESRRSGRR